MTRDGLRTSIDQVYEQLHAKEGALVCALAIVEAAAAYFVECPGDFCLQHVGGEGILVFGASNRLRWEPRYGFRPDRNYCSERFLSRAEFLGPCPGVDHSKLF